ncbi:MAG: hypothetical protein JWM36_4224 [Hyphomicrobiales bacterium]|nr:hypothetical protein [Hyphomicrobiales bacterium]
MTTPVEALLDQLSYTEAAFLVTAADSNVLAFEPREDPMIARLLHLGFLDCVPDTDLSHEMLIISHKGQRVVDFIKEDRERPPT